MQFSSIISISPSSLCVCDQLCEGFIYSHLSVISSVVFLSPANEVWGKEESDILFTSGGAVYQHAMGRLCIPACNGTGGVIDTPLGRHPLDKRPHVQAPPVQTHTPGQTHKPGQTHTPQFRHTPKSRHPLRDTTTIETVGSHPTGMHSCCISVTFVFVFQFTVTYSVSFVFVFQFTVTCSVRFVSSFLWIQ